MTEPLSGEQHTAVRADRAIPHEENGARLSFGGCAVPCVPSQSCWDAGAGWVQWVLLWWDSSRSHISLPKPVSWCPGHCRAGPVALQKSHSNVPGSLQRGFCPLSNPASVLGNSEPQTSSSRSQEGPAKHETW